MAKITLTDGTVIEGTVEELTQYAEKAADMFKYQGDSGMPAEAPEEIIKHNGSEYKLVDRKAQAGDVVVFTENTSCCVRNDYLYGPVFLNNDSDTCINGDEGIRRLVYFNSYNRKPSNVKVYEPVAQEKALKVGDYAKVIKSVKDRNGLVVEITSDQSNVHDYLVESVVCRKKFGAFTSQLVRATDEEVAEAKRQAEQAAVEAKWAKIGRKPNEFKKGDIVRGERSMNGKTIIGEICDISNGLDSCHGITSFVDGEYRAVLIASLELITPVESRFDHA